MCTAGLRTGWDGSLPCECDDAQPIANCIGGHRRRDGGAGLIATAGNDNEVRLWRMRRQDVIPTFVQSLQGHSKVRRRVTLAPARTFHALVLP